MLLFGFFSQKVETMKLRMIFYLPFLSSVPSVSENEQQKSSKSFCNSPAYSENNASLLKYNLETC